MQSFGHAVTDESLIEWTGIPCSDLAREYERSLLPRRRWSEYADQKGREYRRIVKAELKGYPGVRRCLGDLSRSAALGYATSNHRVDADLVLSVTALDELFGFGVAYEDVTEHKPDPEPYLSVSAALGVAPGECIAVEDSPSGISSARRAGMMVAAVSTTFEGDELHEADRVFPATPDACRWIKEICDGG